MLIGLLLIWGLLVRVVWRVPLEWIVALSLILPVPLLVLLSIAAGLSMGLRQRRMGGGRRPPRMPPGWRPPGWGPRFPRDGNGGDRDDGGLAGERVPRRPILPTLSAHAGTTLADDDDDVQPRR